MKAIRVILFIINLILVAAMLFASVAGWVEPSRWIWPSVAAFGFLPLAVANVLMAVVWLLMRQWRVALMPAGALLLRCMLLPAHIQLSGQPDPPVADSHPSAIRLLTYNLHQFHGPDYDSPDAEAIRANAQSFLGMVREVDADVLCLQEYAAVKGINLTDSLLLLGYNHYFGANSGSRGVPYGTVVFSRWPLSYTQRVDQEKVLVEVMHDSLTFRLLDVHLSSYRFDREDFALRDKEHWADRTGDDYKAAAGRTLAKVKETLAGHEREWAELIAPLLDGQEVPIVVAGDFNDIPSSYIHHQLSRRLTDSFTACGRGLGITYRGGVPSYRIDWVFLSPTLATRSHRRLRSDVSDHYPVLVSFEPL